MRFIEIDGKRYDVPDCGSCLFYDGGDGDYYGESCTHPDGDGVCARWGGSCENGHRNSYGPNCPLRTKPELAEGGVIDPSKAGGVYLDPSGNNEEKEIVIPEWVHTCLSDNLLLNGMLALFLPELLEKISKLDLETQERIAKNLDEMMSIAQMKPEERPLCTMDQEESIERGIEACTVKGAKE